MNARRRPVLALLCLCASAAATLSAHADSVNWTNTVGDPIARLSEDQFRYDLDPGRLVRASSSPSASKRASDCLECAPATAFQLSSEERLDQRLRYGYRKLGEDLAARLWDDPKGRRVRFDVAGRPGLGLQIPWD